MKIKKMIFILITIFLLSTSLPIFAIEDIPTGHKKEYCDTMITIGYVGNKDIGNIAVYFEDIATDNKYEFLLESDKGFNSGKIYKILANTTYKVNIKISDDFVIKNQDGTDIVSYHATTSGLFINWLIEDRKEVKKEVKKKEKEVKEIRIDKEDLIEELIENTEFIKDDSRFKDFIEFASSETFKQKYLEENNSIENWEKMSKYERAVYCIAELRPRGFILSNNREIFANNEETFLNTVYKKELFLNCDKNDGEKVYNSFMKIWKWHWNNWEKNRIYKNLFDENIFILNDYKNKQTEETSTIKKSDEKIDNENKTVEITENTAEDNNNSDKEKAEDTDERKKLASKENFFSLITKNVISIFILIILGIIIVILYLKKRSND